MSLLKKYIDKSHPIIFILFAVLAAFGTYSAMYAFRKPFAVATFHGESFFGIDYKILLLTAQVIGYTLSKFIGIKVISELKKNGRAIGIIGLIFFAEAALALFAIIPAPYNIFCLFLNGLPLGMVWGFVFSYLEGRRFTEILGAGLCISFIFSSGFVKSIGKYVIEYWSVSEYWMPFVTGSLFFIPLIIFVYMLDNIPDPTQEDIEQRTERKDMSSKERRDVFLKFWPGLVSLIVVYMFLTAFRDFRDNFAAEMWIELGYGNDSDIFTETEIPISLAVLIIVGLMFKIKNNILAFNISHILIIGGLFLAAISSWAFTQNMLSPYWWSVYVGFGLYIGYVPYNTIFFERLIAAFKSLSNVGFLIYLADSFGYLGSVGVMFYKNFSESNLSWLNFFINGSYLLCIIGVTLTSYSLIYFNKKYKKSNV